MENEKSVVNSVLDSIALEFDDANASYLGKIGDEWPKVFEIHGTKVLVFESRASAFDYCVKRYQGYFELYPQQIVNFMEKYAGKDSWRRFVDSDHLGDHLVINFDRYTKKRFLSSPNRKAMIAELRAFPLDNLIVFTGGDSGKLSKALYPYFSLRPAISEMIRVSGLPAVLDHGHEFKLTNREARKDFYLYPLKELPKPEERL